MHEADESGTDDGRRVRRERNRDSVVDAILELYAEGRLDPSSDEISARAGLSPRSLFRYFDDVDDLCRAAIAARQRQLRPIAELVVAADAPLAERVARLVEGRRKLFEAMGSAGQVARLRAPFHPLIAEQLSQTRSALRAQLADVMAPELSNQPADRSARIVAAADVVCSFEAYQLLRHDQSLTPAHAEAVLAHALLRLLADPES